MRFRPARFLLATVFLLAGCGRRNAEPPGTVAILPFENLSADAGLDWMGRGFAETLRLELTGTPLHHAVGIAALRDAPSAGALQILHGYYSVRRNLLAVQADLEDNSTHRIVKSIAVEEPLSDGMLRAARRIALAVDAQARQLPARNVPALRAYIGAVAQQDPALARSGFEQAIAADPGFGAAYLALAQYLAAHGGRAQAMQVIAAAGNNAGRLQELELAKLSLLSGALKGDRQQQRTALVALTQKDPADPGSFVTLAELETAAHSYPLAAQLYEQALVRKPGDISLLNQLGYVRSWAGDLDGAVKALSQYRDLRPNDANPFDSLGDVHYYLGRFAEAQKRYEEAHAKDPHALDGGELYKAAWARLMQGDAQGAGEMHAKFLQARVSARGLAPYRQAQWDYVTGRSRQAIAALEQSAQGGPTPAGSVALAQLAFWSLEAGDRTRAAAYLSRAATPTSLGALCAFLAQPPAPAQEWSARAERLFPQPAQSGVRTLITAYALLLSKDFAGAVPLLEQLYNASTPASTDWPAIPLAWALAETGHLDRLPQLVNPTPVPDPAGEHPFLSLTFPRIFYLRGLLAVQGKRREEAARNFKLFIEFSAGVPDSFGERARAAQELAGLRP